MKRKYVLVSKNEEGVRIFGLYHDKAYAERVADRINERIEKVEASEFDEWHKSGPGMAPDGYGRVGVQIVHSHDSDRAFRFAMGELDS